MRLGPLIIAVVALGCGDDDETPEAESTTEAPAVEQATPDTEVEAEAPERVRFDLARHRARAELWRGDARLVDFGAPGGARHTLGGWRTRTGDTHTFGETTTQLIEGVTGELLLPIESNEPQQLTFSARAFGDGRLTIYVDGDTVGHGRLPTDGTFTTVTETLPALEPGEHLLQLRVPSTGRDDGVSAGIALDWMRIGAPEEGSAPPPTSLGTNDALAIPAAMTFAYGMDVPSGARLRGTVAQGALRVRALRDGAEALDLGEHDGALDVDLSELAGDFARIDLIASGGAARITEPRIVTLEAPGERRTHRRPKHVLIYLVDTVRADKLHPWNPESRVETPGLDQWVRGAAIFDQGHTQENWTKPSVATLLSGLLPWQHTATTGEAAVPRSVVTLAERLRDQDMATAAFVANGYVSDAFGFEQGFGDFRNYIRSGLRSQARFVASDVLSWLDAHIGEEGSGADADPFFLYVHTIDPHVPYIPPDEILAQYDPEPYEGPIDFTRDRELLEKIKAESLHTNARDRQRLEALYDGEITYHDTHFAAILEGLRRRGLMDDTLVVFTADHGEEFFDHGSVGHGHSLFEELLHVPFVVQLPGIGETRIDEPVGLVDVVPTVLDALEMEPDRALAGRSLIPLLEGHPSDAPTMRVAGFMEGWRALILGRYKLIQRTHRRHFVYDLRNDPAEEHDLAAERPLLLRHLRGTLGLALDGHVAPRAERTQTTVEGELADQLRALGYVGASAPPSEDDAE
ncbi:MAG: sulfatase-like hydrolase/transferase [Deltaproteobacteria bacterium]|nr:sulfatase-like hydrolase/transferase [Deltaproteobacteria bacterium]